MFDSGDHSHVVQLFIVAGFGLGGRNIADGLEEAAVVEPIDPFEGGEFHCFGVAPGSAPVDHLGLEQAVDRLGQGVVIAVADAADRGLDPRFGEALSVADRDVLGGFSWSSQHPPGGMLRWQGDGGRIERYGIS